MWHIIYEFFSYTVFFYSVAIMGFLVYLTLMSLRAQRNIKINMPDDDTIRYILKGSPMTPAVSIIVPAFNEEVSIINNVKGMLNIYYPKFDVIVVNDGSTDDTLKLLLEEFKMREVPFTNTMRVPCKRIKKVYRSIEPEYGNLIVVDKEPGGRKADASNAGINITDNKYFVCTDADCFIEPMALYRMMWMVVNSHTPVIGVGATMLIGNHCVVENGKMVARRVPNNPAALFQELEYMRSFLIGKMGWSVHNALPNISGGFGLFNTEVVVKSGGYDPASFAEDIDLLLRMVTFMHNTGQKYRLYQLPRVACWTEAPFSFMTLYRQRVRWARGLCEIVSNHWKMFFNPHFGPMGYFTLPYIFLFEFMAPIIEILGVGFMVWLVWAGAVNWNTAFVIFGMIYFFAISLTFLVLVFDYSLRAVKWKHTFLAHLKLAFAGAVEAFLFHPFVTTFSIIGYFKYLNNKRGTWAQVRRKGYAGKNKTEKAETENAAMA